MPPLLDFNANHLFPGIASWLLASALLVSAPSIQAAQAIDFTMSRREKLDQLIQSDAGAARLFAKIQRVAADSLNAEPQPVRRIATAGMLAADPAKIISWNALADMNKIAALGWAYQVTTNATYARAARRMILSWAQVYAPSGSPVDETKLEPLFLACRQVWPSFSIEEKAPVEAWLRLIARREAECVQMDSVTASNNWNSHRIKIIGLVGFALGDQTLIGQAESGFKEQVARNLFPDGSSLDFHERDALHYHCYDLEPLLTLAIAANRAGLNLYDFQAGNGASLRKAVNFLIPFCDGTATHAEWVRSKVKFDRDRAEAGEPKFKTGTAFAPRDGLRTLELAAYFDPGLLPLVAKLAGNKTSAYPTWQCVLNASQPP